MTEQQRVFLAIALCLAIFSVWTAMNPPSPPPQVEQEGAIATSQKESQKSAEGHASGKTARGEEKEPVESESAPDQVPAEPEILKSSHRFDTPEFEIEVQNLPLSLKRIDLKQYHERPKEKSSEGENGEVALAPVSLVHSDSEARLQASLHWIVKGKEQDIPLALSEQREHQAIFSGTSRDLDFKVVMETKPGTYGVSYQVAVQNTGMQAIEGFGAGVELAMRDPNPGEEPGLMNPQANILNGLCALGEEVERKTIMELKEALEEGEPPVTGSGSWVAIDRQYFVVGALMEKTGSCSMHARDESIFVRLDTVPVGLESGDRWERSFQIYAGPKRDEALAAVAPGLREIIDYTIMGIPLGFLARPMIFFLNLFHRWTSSWGVAIMILTLLVKTLLLPISYKAAVSMRRMQLLKPQLDKIKSQWANDQQRQQTEQIKLFRETGVNPFGGCLVMFLQMPVWFALYRALWTAVDLYQESFLWLPDLTAKEPGFPFLAVLLGAVTYLQQWLTPMTADNQQAKIMRWVMPGMFVFIMIGLPSGLVLYIFVNSVLTMLQQGIINRSIGAPPSTMTANLASR